MFENTRTGLFPQKRLSPCEKSDYYYKAFPSPSDKLSVRSGMSVEELQYLTQVRLNGGIIDYDFQIFGQSNEISARQMRADSDMYGSQSPPFEHALGTDPTYLRTVPSQLGRASGRTLLSPEEYHLLGYSNQFDDVNSLSNDILPTSGIWPNSRAIVPTTERNDMYLPGIAMCNSPSILSTNSPRDVVLSNPVYYDNKKLAPSDISSADAASSYIASSGVNAKGIHSNGHNGHVNAMSVNEFVLHSAYPSTPTLSYDKEWIQSSEYIYSDYYSDHQPMDYNLSVRDSHHNPLLSEPAAITQLNGSNTTTQLNSPQYRQFHTTSTPITIPTVFIPTSTTTANSLVDASPFHSPRHHIDRPALLSGPMSYAKSTNKFAQLNNVKSVTFSGVN